MELHDFFTNRAGSALRILFFSTLIPQLLQNFDFEVCISALTYGAISILNLPVVESDNKDTRFWNFVALISGSWMTRSVFFNGKMRFVSLPVILDVIRMLLQSSHMFPFKAHLEEWIRNQSPPSSYFSPHSVSSDTVDWAISSIAKQFNSHASTWSKKISEHVGGSLSTVGLTLKQLIIENMDVVRADGDVAFVRFEGRSKVEIESSADLRLSGNFLVVEDAAVRAIIPCPPVASRAVPTTAEAGSIRPSRAG